MVDKLFILPQPLQPTVPEVRAPKSGKGTEPPAVSFAEVLDSRLQQGKINFSKHAASRMASRGINLNNDELHRLGKALDQASAKGSRDSLVLLGDKALVVSITNNTVVTVVDKDNLKGNVFTNIDSAVIA